MIDSFRPSDPTSIHSIYCKEISFSIFLASLLRNPEINAGQYADIHVFLEDNSPHINQTQLSSNNIKQAKEKIKNHLKKSWDRLEEKEDVTMLEHSDKIHQDNYKRIEEEIKERNIHLSYLIGVYHQMVEIEGDIEKYK